MIENRGRGLRSLLGRWSQRLGVRAPWQRAAAAPADGPLWRWLQALVERHAVLSLDVFDTALLRRIDDPASVFSLVAGEYRRSHGMDDSGFDFARERRSAEARARALAWDRERRGDVTHREIYRALALPADWHADELRGLELAVELALVDQNPFVHALYRHARAVGKPVVFVSDMYLPEDFFESALSQAGYRPDALFVSSARDGHTKHSGALYRVVAEVLEVGRHEIFHVGDHPLADVARALGAGCGAWLYERCASRAQHRPGRLRGSGPSAAVMRGLANNRLEAARPVLVADEAAHRTGYAQLGPAFTAFDGDGREIRRALDASLRTRFDLLWRSEPARRGAADFRADFGLLQARFPSLAELPDAVLEPLEHALTSDGLSALRQSSK